MGIKNIHILLITAAVSISMIFGIWGLNHDYQILGIIALVIAVALAAYGVQFLKKAQTL